MIWGLENGTKKLLNATTYTFPLTKLRMLIAFIFKKVSLAAIVQLVCNRALQHNSAEECLWKVLFSPDKK
jgi:hypothetical protein